MKRKLLLAACALLLGVSSVWAQPTASTPVVGNTYYLYNPTTKLFMTTNVDLPFVRPTGSAWKLENGTQDGFITLRLKDNTTDGCGYFWGKWWANNPAGNSNDYAGEREYKLVNSSGTNYKLQSYAWGETTSYIYINNGNEGDRSYRLACNSHEQGGLDEGYVTWQFISEEDYATYMSTDYTSYIANNDFLSGTGSWTLEGTGNKQAHGNTAIEYWKEKAADGNFDYYQNITVPAGKYVLRAAMYNSTNGESGASFDTAGQCGVYGTSGGTTKNANVTVDGTAYNIYTTDGLLVADGNLRLGFKNSTTMTARWFGVDWIQLTCEDYCISYVATELPTNGAMEADTWYKYTVSLTGNYTISATTTADIIQTTNADQLLGEATGDAITTGEEVALTEGDVIYYKSSSANTLTIEANIKTYVVGTATADIPYVKEGNTVTVTWADAITNDKTASFAINGTPSITFGGNVVTVTPTATGFTFTVPEVTINTTYTLSIPAGAFGYAAGSTYNEAQNISFKTPLFADGDYYLKNKSNDAYFAGGMGWGTQAITNSLGHVVNLTALSNGNYTINTYLFNGGTSSANHFLNGLWCDGASVEWTFAADGEYYTINDGTNNLTAGTIGAVMSLAAGTGDNTKWQLLTPAQWKAENVARLDAATVDNGVDATFYIASPNFNRNDDLENAKWQGNPNIGGFADGTSQNLNAEKYNTTPFDVYQELTGLKPGVYKVTMQGFYRNGTTDDRNVFLYANDFSVAIANIRSTAIAAQDDDKGFTTANDDSHYVPNSQTDASKAFNNNYYNNELEFTVASDGALRIGVKKTTGASADWAVFDNFQLTYYGALDYSALQTAYDAVEVPTLGFEAGEYAPYTNASNLQALATAKELLDNETALTQSEITTAKSAVEAISSWTVNAAQLDAIYDGGFSNTVVGSVNTTGVTGWSTEDVNNMRQIFAADKFESGKGLYIWPVTIKYGETAGYTMPLEANSIYKFTYSFAGQGNTVGGEPTISLLSSTSNGLALTGTGTGAPVYTAGVKTYTVYFLTGNTKENYVFTYNAPSGTNTVLGDLSLKKVDALEFADGSVPNYVPGTYPSVKITRSLTAGRWATAVYPFAVSGVDNIAVLDSYNAGALGFTTATVSTANVPFLMRSATNKTEISLSNVAVAAASVTNATAGDAKLIGSYAQTNITNAEKNYVLSNNAIYSVGDAGATINPYRAYIQLTESAPAAKLRFVIDGEDATGIEEIAAGQKEDGVLYNVAGQVVTSDYKGIVIKNGKKYLNK